MISKNYLVFLSSEPVPNLDLLKDIQFRNKKNFCFIGFILSSDKAGSSEYPKLKCHIQSELFKYYFKQIEWLDIYITPIEKLTTQLREYVGLMNLEHQDIKQSILSPKDHILCKKVPDPHIFDKFFQTVQNRYNQSQYEAIREITQIKEGICLLQGPPGTGKTYTLIGIISGIYHYMKNSNSNFKNHILICAPSNTAIDEIITRIMENGLFNQDGDSTRVKLVRIGVLDSNCSDLVKSVSLEHKAQAELYEQQKFSKDSQNCTDHDLKDQLDKINSKIQKIQRNPNDDQSQIQILYDQRRIVQSRYYEQKQNKRAQKEKYETILMRILQDSDIICTTLGSSGSEKLNYFKNQIETVIIDEASQCCEPGNIIPLQYSMKKMVLIGDPKQLPATTFSYDSNSTLYNRSLFERILQNGIQPYFLNEQYRMHANIRKFPSSKFYQNRLKDSQTVKNRHIPQYLKCFKSRNVFFIDLPFSKEIFQDMSYLNIDEAKLSMIICQKIIEKINQIYIKDKSNCIGVIAPYKKQVQCLKKQLMEFELQDYKDLIQINTVDSFQGQEKDVIVFQTVRANQMDATVNNQIGFLNDERRMNVALTRAKHVQFVIGNSKTLSSNPLWMSFIDHMVSSNNYIVIPSATQINKIMDLIFQGDDIPKQFQDFEPIVRPINKRIQKNHNESQEIKRSFRYDDVIQKKVDQQNILKDLYEKPLLELGEIKKIPKSQEYVIKKSIQPNNISHNISKITQDTPKKSNNSFEKHTNNINLSIISNEKNDLASLITIKQIGPQQKEKNSQKSNFNVLNFENNFNI